MLSKKYLNKNKELNFASTIEKAGDIVQLIPVYKEVNLIENSINYFGKLKNINVIYITSSKETNKATYNIGRQIIIDKQFTNIKIINSPNLYGNMATQLNYGLKYVSKNAMVGLYNVDSRPSQSTFDFVRSKHNEEISVFQQVSYFNDDLKGILLSAQRWQNRWSVIFELGRLLKPTTIDKYRYTIGHGFFCKKSILDKIGGWPNDEINEDNALGYYLSVENISIYPIPFFEQSDFARSLEIYINQQATWFNGPFYAFKYFLKCNKKTLGTLFMTFVNFKAAISWILGPILYLFTSIWSICNIFNYFLFLTSLMVIYITFYNFLASRLLKNYLEVKFKYSYILFDILFYIVHCFGPILTIWKILLGRNNIENKYNTEKKY